MPHATDGRVAVCIDMGTTNTRAWLVRGVDVLARAQAGVGVRDTAITGSPAGVRSALRKLIEEVRLRGGAMPSCVAASGMITSSLGLADVPHIPAPAGAGELAAAARRHSFPDVTDLPVVLVPGVWSGPRNGDPDSLSRSDVMRGEETLCVGLLANGVVRAPATVLNLGSHWKAVQLDPAGRIVSSFTSVSGELIHAAQTQTVLASAVPHERPSAVDMAWCEAGMREQRRSSLGRALFCVRLYELAGEGAPEQRLSFLIGAFVAADVDALLSCGILTPSSQVAIAGGSAVVEAWRHALEQVPVAAVKVTEAQSEGALLAGLVSIVGLSPKGD